MSKRLFAGLALAGLAMLVVLPTASAAPGGVDRPFKASFVGEARWEFPGPAGCEIVTTIAATGEVVWTYAVVPVLIPGCTDPMDFRCLDFSVPWQWSSTMVGHISY